MSSRQRPSKRFRQLAAKAVRARKTDRRRDRFGNASRQVSIGVIELLEDRLLLSGTTISNPAALATAAVGTSGSPGPLSPVGVNLATLYYQYAQYQQSGSTSGFTPNFAQANVQSGDVVGSSVSIFVQAKSSTTAGALTTALQGLGMNVVVTSGNEIGGWLPVSQLASVAALPGLVSASASGVAQTMAPPPIPSGNGVFVIDPAEMQGAYGVNQLYKENINGAGMTIAIVIWGNDPDIITDADAFSQTYGLPQFNQSSGPKLTVLNQTGGTTLPADDFAGGDDVEESLDVEWSHSMAPQANIIVFEANGGVFDGGDLADALAAVQTAAAYPGVSVVSMSWGGGETPSELSSDPVFTTPAGHQGVTFLAATGDSGFPGYPALSPNVVAVGGTALNVDQNGNYLGEAVWNAANLDGDTGGGSGGGGVSEFEPIPSYQVGNVNGISSTNRVVPDVSMDAGTVVDVVDSYYTGSTSFGLPVGGTSLATPMWAGLMALTNQDRASADLTTLNGLTQTLPYLYGLPNSDFHDITEGDNGVGAFAGPGYDDASGIGTPIANLLVPDLAHVLPPITAPTNVTVNAGVAFDFTGPNAISVTDTGNGGNDAQTLTLTANGGTIDFVDTAGLTITGNGLGSVTASGLLTALNTDLASLTYTANFGPFTDTLTLLDKDTVDGYVTPPATVAITINQPPEIIAPASVTVEPGLAFDLGTVVSVTKDNPGSTDEQTLTLSAGNGNLDFGTTTGLVVTGNDSGSVTATGTFVSLDNDLTSLTYTPNASATSDTLTLSDEDTTQSLFSSITTIAVTVNEAPVITPSPVPPSTLQLFRNTVDTTSGASATGAGNTSVASIGNVVFMTGNSFQAVSTDHGNSFSSVPIPTNFSAYSNQWGTFDGDQRLAQAPSQNMVLWYLEYGANGATSSSTNGVILASAVGASAVAGNTWTPYEFTPTSFGYGTGYMLQSPQMQTSRDFVYMTSNVVSLTTDQLVGAVMWRVSLSQLAAGGGITFNYWTFSASSQGGANLALVNGAQGTMYAASNYSPSTGVLSTSLVVYSQAELSTAVTSTTVSGLEATAVGPETSLDPNGTNWLADINQNVSTGWISGSTLGFAWNSGAESNRTSPFVRVVELNTSTLAVTSQPDIWNSGGIAFADAAISTDATGGLGGSLYEGGSTEFPSLDLLLADNVTGPPPSWSLTQVAAGTADNAATYGGYLGATPDSVFTNTFLIAGEIDQSGSVVPDFTWFGRHSNAPIDLSGYSFPQTITAEPGQSVTLTFSVQNTEAGDAADPLVEFFLTQNSTVSSTSSADYLLASTNLTVVDGFSEAVETITFNLPAASASIWGGGPYTIGMVVNPPGLVGGVEQPSLLPEANLANNSNQGVGIDLASLTLGTASSPSTSSNFPLAVSAPPAASVVENSSLNFGASISVADSNSTQGATDTLTLSVSTGRLTLGSTAGLTFVSGTTNDSAAIMVTGTLTNLNAALNGLAYAPTPGQTAADVLSITIFDGSDSPATGTATVAIKVVPLAPVITAPSQVTVVPNGTLHFVPGELSISDASATSTSDSYRVIPTDGTVNGSVTGFSTAGSLAGINSMLGSLVFQPSPGFTGTATIEIRVANTIDDLITTDTVDILVVDPPPVVSAPPTASVNENGMLAFATSPNLVSVTDQASGTQQLTLSVDNGALTLLTTTGLTVSGNDSNSLTLTGSVTSLNNDLPSLTYTPTSEFSGTDTLTISDTDTQDSLTGRATVGITVVGLPPQITAPLSVAVPDGTFASFTGSDSITITDAAGTSSTVEQLLLLAQFGTLNLVKTTGLTTVIGQNTGTLELIGPTSNLNTDLATLTYTPGASYTGNDAILLSVTDTLDNLTSTTSVTVGNAPPAVSGPHTINANEDSTLTFSSVNQNAITLIDSWATTSSETLTLQVNQGTLDLASTTGLTFLNNTSNNSASIDVTGSLAALNTALNGLVYTPTSSYSGPDSLSLQLSNSADNLMGSAAISITVIAPPVVVLGTPPTPPVAAGSVVQLNATVTNTNTSGGTLVTQWQVANGPGTVTFANSASPTTTATFSVPGIYYLRLVASYGGATDQAYLTVTVDAVVPPSMVNLQQGTNTYSGMTDTYINNKKGNDVDNYVTSTTLEVYDNPNGNYEALLDWNLTGNAGTLKSASITVYVTSASTATYNLYALTTSWNANTVTYDQPWQLAGAYGANDFNSTLLGTLTASTIGYNTITLNTAGIAVVQSWLNNPSLNDGFIVRGTTNNSIVFASSKYGTIVDRPQLALNFSQTVVAPPPVLVTNPVTSATTAVNGTSGVSNTGYMEAVGVNLATLYFQYVEAQQNNTTFTPNPTQAGVNSADIVGTSVDVVVTVEPTLVSQVDTALAALGMTSVTVTGNTITGLIPISQLANLAMTHGVVSATAAPVMNDAAFISMSNDPNYDT